LCKSCGAPITGDDSKAIKAADSILEKVFSDPDPMNRLIEEMKALPSKESYQELLYEALTLTGRELGRRFRNQHAGLSYS
jgi:hypothetical protein